MGTPVSSKQSIVPMLSSSPNDIQKATLQSEHGRIMNDASQFIQGVLGAKSPSPQKSVSSNNRKSRDSDRLKVDQVRLAEFFSALHELMEHNDGILSEDDLFEDLNRTRIDDKRFAQDQIEELLEHLSKENKIMRCDGQIFTI